MISPPPESFTFKITPFSFQVGEKKPRNLLLLSFFKEKNQILTDLFLYLGQTFRIDFRSEESSSADPKCVPLSEEELLDAKQKTASPDRKLLRLPNGESFAFSVSGNGSEVRIEKLDHQSVVVSSSPLLWIPYAKIVSLYTENGILCAMDSLEQLHLLESPQFHRSALLDTSSFSALAIKVLENYTEILADKKQGVAHFLLLRSCRNFLCLMRAELLLCTPPAHSEPILTQEEIPAKFNNKV